MRIKMKVVLNQKRVEMNIAKMILKIKIQYIY